MWRVEALSLKGDRGMPVGTGVVQDPTTGYYAVSLSIFFFGTNYIPVKHIKVGDGVFFQFVMCVAILAHKLSSFVLLGWCISSKD